MPPIERPTDLVAGPESDSARREERRMEETRHRRYLVLVIGTLAGPGPAGELLRLSRREPSSFDFLVPASIPKYGWTWTEAQSVADARERIQIVTEFGRAMGLNLQAEVVPSDDPVEVVSPGHQKGLGALRRDHRDRPSEGPRRWMENQALDELERNPGLPLTRLEANPPLGQGKEFDLDELRRLFQEFLRSLPQDDRDTGSGRRPGPVDESG
jgi:hypothetical protein